MLYGSLSNRSAFRWQMVKPFALWSLFPPFIYAVQGVRKSFAHVPAQPALKRTLGASQLQQRLEHKGNQVHKERSCFFHCTL